MEEIPHNPQLTGSASVLPEVTFALPGGKPLAMTILVPWAAAPAAGYPLLVFLQGSAWTDPNRNAELPQLAQYAQQGMVVASITHRSVSDGFMPPAYLEDAKTAIRFLRHHAGDLNIDPHRVAFWGTSSGGNTAELIGLTGDDPQYKTNDFPEESDAVTCVVSCFGVADLVALTGSALKNAAGTAAFRRQHPKVAAFIQVEQGMAHAETVMRAMSPKYQVAHRTTSVPMLLMHGTADTVVPFAQSEQFAAQLRETGIANELVAVTGADHESDFWSPAVHQRIRTFLKQQLG
ncbi:prolyl oligopeptidase family serine peptidase [Schleiferilactobacillus shenzhenensis]|nr:prolyl oligopeptidase family serine peptidase [Schleiferilactobacillus shenzhenensis]